MSNSKSTALKDITIRGNITRDPELRFTPSGAAVANFSVAVNDRRFDKATGEWTELEPTFINVTVWRGLAENVAESLRAGNRVVVTGKFGPRSYDDKEGRKVTVWEMEAEDVATSLAYATVQITKVNRNGGSAPAAAAPSSASDDPWAASEDDPFGA